MHSFQIKSDINNANHDSNSKALERIVNKATENFVKKNKLNEKQASPLLCFNPNKPASSPKFDIDREFFCTFEMIKSMLHKLNSKKSAGHDRIPNLALKRLPDSLIKQLVILFNNLLNNAYFLEKCKLPKVMPIFKKNQNPNSHKSYRPISLLPNLGKFFETKLIKV